MSTRSRLEGMLRRAQDERLAELAVQKGLLDRDKLEAARAESEAVAPGGASPSLAQVLAERGWLPPSAWQALEAALVEEDFVRPAAQEAALPPEALAAATAPNRQLGGFLLVEQLGRGGSGEVWKGWDRKLGRWVAIKLPASAFESRSGRERFAREALSAGLLSHPNIVPVYQVGEEDGRSYLVMPLIEGRTLDQIDMPARQALEIMRTVALAVDHAHRHGLVHRDLKPANLMLDRNDQPWILDFGLAHLRDQQGWSLTAPGDVLGTAAYMSPEQAKGDARGRDPATDIYGLGATLYHLLTGRPPFRADTFAATVAQVVDADPTPPRKIRPALEPEVETVVWKAMAKDPERRYRTAAEMADDLRRLVDHERISARRPGVAVRVGGALRKKRATLWAAIVVLAVSGVAAWAHWREQSERAAAVEGLREMTRMSLESALRLRRAGDIAGLKQVLPTLLGAYERVRAQAPDVPDIEYSMGRLHRALMNETEALAHQERALAKNPAFAPALYERAILLSERYGRERRDFEARTSFDAEDVRGERKRLPPRLQQWEKAIIDDLSGLHRLRVDEATNLAAAGILAYHQLRLPEAVATLERAVALDPYREEAWMTLARAAEDMRRWDQAERMYTSGLTRDRGYLPYLEGRCSARHILLDFVGCEADAAQVLAADPRNRTGQECSLSGRLGRALDSSDEGIDPRPVFAAAEAELGRMLDARPNDFFALLQRGAMRRYRGRYAMARGLNPLPDLDGAYADLSRATEGDKENSATWGQRGRALMTRGLYRAGRDEDPSDDFRAAEADFNQAVRVSPRLSLYRRFRAHLWAERAAFSFDHGREFAADLESAEAEYDKALTIASGDAVTRGLRARMRILQGRALARAGHDPLPPWKSGEDDLGLSIEKQPRNVELWIARGMLRLERAAHRRRNGGAARSDLAAAGQDIDRALALDASLPEAWAGRALVKRLRGDGRGAAGDEVEAVRRDPAWNGRIDRLRKRLARSIVAR